MVWPPHESRESRSLKWYVSLSTGGKPQCGVARTLGRKCEKLYI